ncbi:MAG: CPBP family intramembrane metalloprotease [Melioribacteraceae bacterium]|nr:CPBP family intramembrane metalloprotease [Melioribacteraceae bacterium]MCF8355480.1 CPBP family intramembrane metalloprotease [Melioribacteraceae bacterium]MCF8394905.1 CPBP family intramembrane metalloprotease [Melioribacteraceae bacterium]MCF8420453.1 CPBP family intramembrane metalloprotease [Melioribacteraceae bacterium]
MKDEIKKLVAAVKTLDRKVTIVFISVALLQTISWYYTSRSFFRKNFYYTIFKDNPDVGLYEYLYWFIGDFITFFAIPLLLILFLLKERPNKYGLQLGDSKLGFKLSGYFILFMLPLLWIVSSFPEFVQKYPHLATAKTSISILLIFELGMLIYMTGWEFIWRGYMLFGLKDKFGYYAIFIQMIPFVILHNGKPDIETFSAILGALALGVLAYRTGSFIYGVIVHFGIMFGIDIISVLRYRANDYGIGIDSFINIFVKLFD